MHNLPLSLYYLLPGSRETSSERLPARCENSGSGLARRLGHEKDTLSCNAQLRREFSVAAQLRTCMLLTLVAVSVAFTLSSLNDIEYSVTERPVWSANTFNAI